MGQSHDLNPKAYAAKIETLRAWLRGELGRTNHAVRRKSANCRLDTEDFLNAIARLSGASCRYVSCETLSGRMGGNRQDCR